MNKMNKYIGLVLGILLVAIDPVRAANTTTFDDIGPVKIDNHYYKQIDVTDFDFAIQEIEILEKAKTLYWSYWRKF